MRVGSRLDAVGHMLRVMWVSCGGGDLGGAGAATAVGMGRGLQGKRPVTCGACMCRLGRYFCVVSGDWSSIYISACSYTCTVAGWRRQWRVGKCLLVCSCCCSSGGGRPRLPLWLAGWQTVRRTGHRLLLPQLFCFVCSSACLTHTHTHRYVL